MSKVKASQPIGIFDSGVGGVSIFEEIHQLMPHEDIIYLADSKNAPYGERPVREIIDLCVKNTELLLEKNCKLIVVACNTATTNAIDYLRRHYSVPFVGIEPAIKPAALNSQTKTIGILATKGTLSSRLFHKTADLFAQDTEVIEVIGSGLVERIEAGQVESPETRAFLGRLLKPLLQKDIDFLVLGCSHYPFLIPLLRVLLPDHVKIIDSGHAVAQQVQRILQKNKIEADMGSGKIQFHINIKKSEVLKSLIKTSDRYEIAVTDF